MGNLKEAALQADAVPIKTRPGWFDLMRERDADAYREVFELVRDFEAGDAALRAKYPSRVELYRSVLRGHLEEQGFPVSQSAFESYARRVGGGDRHVQP